MIKKSKRYSRPKRPFDKTRIEEEAEIKEEYGLKNKKEIWKAEAKVKLMRERAKEMISASLEEQKALFERLSKIGIKVNSISDILSLNKKDYLEQRLQTIITRKKIAKTMKSARQLITHKKVLVDGKVVDSPSYIVPVELRDKIRLKDGKIKTKKEEIKTEEDLEENENE